MLKLYRLTLNTFAVEDSDLIASKEIAVGTMLEAKSFMQDVHGTSDDDFARALAEMTNRGTNVADFGINGGFIYTERQSLESLQMKVSVHMKARS